MSLALRLLLPLSLACGFLAGSTLARADVVKLKNGSEIRGKIVREDTTSVVVRSRGGTISFPRKDIAEVVRESREATLLHQAKSAIRLGKAARARALLERVLEGKDAALQADAKELLTKLDAEEQAKPEVEPGRQAGEEGKPGEDPFTIPEPEALFRELEADAERHPAARRELAGRLIRRANEHYEKRDYLLAASDYRRARLHAAKLEGGDIDLAQLTRAEHVSRLRLARQAVRKRKAKLAVAAASGPVEAQGALAKELRAPAHYLYGRALDLSNRRQEALRSYQSAIGRDLGSRGDIATYRELARLASVGVEIGEHSPGVGEGWRWVWTRNFAILHRLPPDPRLGTLFEGYHAAVVRRLGLQGKLDEKERIPVFIYPSEEEYRRSAGARHWSAGHASRLQSGIDEEEVVRSVYFYPSPNFDAVARHEIAHILTWDALDNALLPSWAAEGSALYAEPENVRLQRLAYARQVRERFVPSEQLLGRIRLPSTDDSGEIGVFYVQSAASFHVLAERLGVHKAFKVALAINTEGPEKALRSVGWSLRSFEGQLQKLLAK